jgi:hypothetical protein
MMLPQSLLWTLALSPVHAVFQDLAQKPLFSADSPSNPAICRLQQIPGVYLGEGIDPPDKTCVRSTGHVRAFMMFVNFTDAPSTDESPGLLWRTFLPEGRTWFLKQSWSRLTLDTVTDFTRFYTMPHPSRHYGLNGNITAEKQRVYIQDAVDTFFAANPQYNLVTDVLWIVPPTTATLIPTSPTYMAPIYHSGKLVANRSVTFGIDAYFSWGYKVLNHETLHTMCLPDLYSF